MTVGELRAFIKDLPEDMEVDAEGVDLTGSWEPYEQKSFAFIGGVCREVVPAGRSTPSLEPVNEKRLYISRSMNRYRCMEARHDP